MCCIYPILMLTVVDFSLQNTSVALRALQRQVSLFLKASLIVLNGRYMVSSCIFQKGQFHIPDDLQLVSCIYWLCCSQKFAKPVKLEIEHCALLHDSSQSSSLRFIAAKCSQAELPYQFRVLEKGMFAPTSSYGSIEISQFSFFAIVIPEMIRRMWSYRYYSRLYYTRINFNTWDVDFVITQHLQAALAVSQCIVLCCEHYLLT